MEPEVTKVNNGVAGGYRYDPTYRKDPLGVELRSCEKTDGAKEETCFTPTIKTTGFILLLVVFLVNLSGTILLWGTNVLENSIIQDLAIVNNTQTYDWWVNPPVQPYMQVRVFNYTNVEAFLSGDADKLTVEEVGPYVYSEVLERVNVVFNANGTVSYQEKRSFTYVPERSTGNLKDHIVVPNMAFLGAVSIMKDSYYVVRLSMSTLFRSMDVKPFLTLTAENLFWGYEDPVFVMAKSFKAFSGVKDGPENQKIGLLVARNGTSSARITIHTGTRDIDQLGMFDRYNGKDSLAAWGTSECNRVDGTDGSMWPPNMVHEDATVYMFMKDMCRKFPLVFKENVEVFGGMTAMRFHPPRDVFATGDERADNACYCHEHASCPPAGVFNSSPCAFNAPVMMSFPHFYLGDPALVASVDGLRPDAAKHDMFMDIHPKFGFPMAGESRFQVNIMVRKSNGISHLDRFKDETILPIAWFEVLVGDIPPEMIQVMSDLHFATHTLKRIVLATFLVTLVLVAMATAHYVHSRYRHARFNVFQRGGGAKVFHTRSLEDKMAAADKSIEC